MTRKPSATPTADSPVMQMFALFRRNSMTATGHSWTRMNGAYQGIMQALIVGGVKFELEDFSRVYEKHDGHYWFGADGPGCQGERFYILACEWDNVPACRSFEHWKSRKPLKLAGKRLCLGSELTLPHLKERFIVTSIHGEEMVVCAYEYVDSKQKVVARTRLDQKKLDNGAKLIR